jgi:anaerobic glycerol-3-phosphate dehydrogenase
MLSRPPAPVKPLPRAFSAAYLAAMQHVDVLVIGGGAAGFSAAMAARAAGVSVAVVRAGPGATALAGGGWSGTPPAAVRAALAAAGLELQPLSAPLPHPDGRVLHHDWAPAAHAAAALAGAEPTLVCGIAGLGGFNAHALVQLWSGAAALRPGLLAAACIELPGTPRAGWMTTSLAAMLERDAGILLEPARAAAAAAGCARAIVPAVAGLTRSVIVQDDGGIAIGEALGTAPSVPGWRLDTAIRAALERAAVPVAAGRARLSLATDGWTARVTSGADTARTFAARSVVLATGGFVGGGLAGDPLLVELAAELPVHVAAAGREFRSAIDCIALTTADAAAAQPLLRAGVRQEDAPPGLFVAGAVRAGTDSASLGLGTAALEGWSAGERAALLAAAWH